MIPNVTGTQDQGWSSGGGRVEAGLKKGPWTAAEDSILADYMRKHGEGNWNVVERNSGLNRCGKSCRLRWTNHLRPNLKKCAFSSQEERTVLELHAKFGNKLARMVAVKFVVGELDIIYTTPGAKEYVHGGGFKRDVPLLEEIVVMEGVGHFINQEKAEEINSHIFKFFSKF